MMSTCRHSSQGGTTTSGHLTFLFGRASLVQHLTQNLIDGDTTTSLSASELKNSKGINPEDWKVSS